MKSLAKLWLFTLFVSGAWGCGESKFQNEAAPTQAPAAPKAEAPLEAPVVPVAAQKVETPLNNVDATVAVAKETTKEPEPPAPPPPPPPGAVVKGSFTVYAEPANPKPGQDYQIFVKVMLPPGAAETYQRKDLSIQVTGTDGFTATFPQGGGGIGGQKNFSVSGNIATAIMLIPGAESNVKDTIVCKSQLLKETQQIQLIFGAKPAP